MMQKISKKITALFLVFAMLMATGFTALADANPVTVFVDGEQILFDTDPIIENGRTLVPMRAIFEALDAQVEWNSDTKTAIATKGDITIKITIGQHQMFKNDTAIELDVPAKLVNNRTLVPARAVSEGLEAQVNWDAELRQVIITSGGMYSLTELSPADMELLVASKEQGRYAFEQVVLPSVIFAAPQDAADLLTGKDPDFPAVVEEIWDLFFMELIIQIQTNSSDNYVIDEGVEITEEILISAYENILKTISMDVGSNFEVAYDTTPGGKDVLLITFHSTESEDPMMILCKYIALVMDGENIRYFTAEKGVFTEAQHMLCEIDAGGRGSYETIGVEKADFLAGVDKIIDQDVAFPVYTPDSEE